jgi:hypothetical protein
MASAVQHRDQALRDALDEQTVLLREVHHRVKNNLQIVASLLSLQASRIADPAARDALQDALVRIDSMSLTQRFMQQQEEEDRISTVDLFEAFVAQARARLGGPLGSARKGLTIATEIEPLILPLDMGSRLVLVAAEALICAFRSSGPERLNCNFKVCGQPQGVQLAVLAVGHPEAFAQASVSRDLIGGYVRQLRGTLEAAPGTGVLTILAPWPAGFDRSGMTDSAYNLSPGAGEGLKFFRILDRTHGPVVS